MKLMQVESCPDLMATGWLFQLTLGRKLLDTAHYHRFYEIICVLYGECRQVANGTEHCFSVGDLVILRPMDSHSFSGQSDGTNVLVISVIPSEMQHFLSAYGLIDNKAFCGEFPEGSPPMLSLNGDALSRIYEVAKETLTRQSIERVDNCRILLGIILSAFIRYRRAADIGMPTGFAEIIAQMNHLDAAMEGIPAFLRISNYSHAQLCRLTKQYLSLTPSQFVNSVRMKYAWELVVHSEQSYESICAAIGFSSFSYFHRLFTETFHITPSVARRRNADSARTV